MLKCVACWLKISADNILKYFFFSQKKGFCISQGDNLHECETLFSDQNKKKYHQFVINLPKEWKG